MSRLRLYALWRGELGSYSGAAEIPYGQGAAEAEMRKISTAGVPRTNPGLVWICWGSVEEMVSALRGTQSELAACAAAAIYEGRKLPGWEAFTQFGKGQTAPATSGPKKAPKLYAEVLMPAEAKASAEDTWNAVLAILGDRRAK